MKKIGSGLTVLIAMIAISGALILAGCANPTTSVTKSRNAKLKDITVSSGTLSPTFSADTTAYTVSVVNTVSSVTVAATAEHSKATVAYSSSQPVSLVAGTPKTVTITVTAEDESTSKITVTITRQADPTPVPSTNANLKSITVDKGTLSPTFAANTTAYTVSVANTVSSVKVTATQEDSKATVEYNLPLGTASSLAVGKEQKVTITVTAEDGTTTKAYTVTITRQAPEPPSTNANLKSITVDKDGALDPEFSADKLEYTVSVSVSSVTVTATAEDSKATVTYDPSQTVSNLVAGTPKTVTIKVTAEDGTTSKTYTVTITRQQSSTPSTNANLKSITVSSGTLSPAFSEDKLEYAVSVSVSSVTVTATAEDSKATVTYDPSQTVSNLVAGTPKTVTIKVTAEDGTTSKTYTVTITRQSSSPSNNANLKGITVSSGTLSPTFSADKLEYTVSVSASSVTVTATKDDSGATVAYSPSQPVSLVAGTPKTVTITVTAADKSTSKEYTVAITQQAAEPPSNNANLKSIIVDKGTLSPTFSPNILAYTVSVANTVSSVTVTATKDDSDATVVYSLSQTVSNLVAGTPKTVTITVTAEDESTSKTYTVTITRYGSGVNVGIGNETIVLNGVHNISKKSYQELEISVSGSYDGRPYWYVDGTDYGEYGDILYIHSSNMPVGTHTVAVVVYKDGIPYSAEESFQVTK